MASLPVVSSSRGQRLATFNTPQGHVSLYEAANKVKAYLDKGRADSFQLPAELILTEGRITIDQLPSYAAQLNELFQVTVSIPPGGEPKITLSEKHSVKSSLSFSESANVNTHLDSCKILAATLRQTPVSDPRYQELQNHALQLIKLYVQEEDLLFTQEVSYLAAANNSQVTKKLVGVFAQQLQGNVLLEIETLEGLREVFLHADLSSLDHDNMARILHVIHVKLTSTLFENINPTKIIYVLRTLASLLKAMGDANVEGLDRITVHEALYNALALKRSDRLTKLLAGSQDPELTFYQSFARQALVRIPNNEHKLAAGLRRAICVGEGISTVASIVAKAIPVVNSFSDFIDFAKKQDANKLIGAFKLFYEGFKSQALQAKWYDELWVIEFLLQTGNFSAVEEFIYEKVDDSPTFEFTVGLALSLSEFIEQSEELELQLGAIKLLERLFSNNGRWNDSKLAKQLIIDRLLHAATHPKEKVRHLAQQTIEEIKQNAKLNKTQKELLQAAVSTSAYLLSPRQKLDSADENRLFKLYAESGHSLEEAPAEDEEAVSLRFKIKSLKSSDQVLEIYQELFSTLPVMGEITNLIQCLPQLLFFSGHLKNEQEQLAFMLGKWYEDHAQLDFAMHYYSQAWKVNPENPRPATTVSKLFIKKSQHYLLDEKAFHSRLVRCAGQAEAFKQLLSEIEDLKVFCVDSEDQALIKKLYSQVKKEIDHLHARAIPESFEGVANIVAQTEFALPSHTAVQKYRAAARAFQELFHAVQDPAKMRETQAQLHLQLKQLFKEFLADTVALLGPAPCAYDIRLTGDAARQELCPQSNFELSILIKDEKYQEYFKQLGDVLRLQLIASGSEIQSALKFTCDRGTSSLNLQLIPLESVIITTPELAAESDRNLLGSLRHRLLTSQSFGGEDSLIKVYKARLNKRYSVEQQKAFALQLVKLRLQRAFEVWEDHRSFLTLQAHFVEPLSALLTDLASYFCIDSLNPLDIVHALIIKEHFNPQNRQLLVEAIAFIHALRVRLAQEEMKLAQSSTLLSPTLGNSRAIQPNSPKNKTLPYQLQLSEQRALEKIYQLVIRPLHGYLDSLLNQPENFADTFKEFKLEQVAWQQHQDHYQSLSHEENGEELKSSHLQNIEKLQLPFFTALTQLPTRSGLRQSFLREEQDLHADIEAISAESPHGNLEIPEVKVTGPFGIRYLKADIAKTIVDDQLNLNKVYQSAMHRVTPLSLPNYPQLHFKQKPIHPLMEYAVHNLTSRIAGSLTPATQLLRFEMAFAGRALMYPVLVSKTIEGIPLKNVPAPHWDSRSWAQWTWFYLCNILIRPGDGLPSNYVIDRQNRIYSIDNDISLAEPIDEDLFSKKVNFCSAIFCLFENIPLDREVLEEFCALDSDALLNDWIEDVIEKEKEYMGLFSEEERKQLYEEDKNNAFTPQILFREGALATLDLQFWNLQVHLKTALEKKEKIMNLDLLRQLISPTAQSFSNSVGAYVYEKYRRTAALQLPLERRLQQIVSRSQSMTSIQSATACLGKIPKLIDIEQKKKFSVEFARLELFATLFQRCSNNVVVRTQKGQTVIKGSFAGVSLSRQEIILKGLTSLVSEQKTISVALQHCDILDTKKLKPFLKPELSHLDLRYCKQIGDKDVEMIRQKCPNLQELYLSGCDKLQKLLENRSTVAFYFRYLECLYLSSCAHLQMLTIWAPKLRVFKASNNPNFEDLLLFESPRLKELDVKKCPKFSPKTKLAITNLYLKIDSDIQSFNWFEEMASHGDADAQNRLGDYYRHGHGVKQADDEAFKWYEISAEQDCAQGQYSLGFMYQNGLGVQQSDLKALDWFNRAADQGLAGAQQALGFMHLNSQGDQQLDAKAFGWFEKAANQGDIASQYILAFMYVSGRFVVRSFDEAFSWFKKTVKPSESQSNPGLMSLSSQDDEMQSVKQAFIGFERAANKGLAQVQNYLGDNHSNGLGVVRSNNQAFKWYERAAKLDYAPAQLSLAFMYQQGLGVMQSHPNALIWFEKAAKQGSAEAQYQLGIMYRDGQGTDKSEEKSLYWLRKAADSHFPPAVDLVGLTGKVEEKDDR